MVMAAQRRKGSRVVFLGRHLMVKGEYVDMILSGRKRATIRLGIVKVKYPELIVHGGGRPIAKVKVTDVVHKRVSELTDEDAREDGFNNVKELLDALRRVYGDVKPDDYVTIIKFQVTQDLSKLEPEHPYLGLEPADVARLGLRYLRGELSDKEAEILRDLTVTRSIRATSIRFFGTIEKRWIIRRLLKRVLRELVRRGILRKSGGNQ